MKKILCVFLVTVLSILCACNSSNESPNVSSTSSVSSDHINSNTYIEQVIYPDDTGYVEADLGYKDYLDFVANGPQPLLDNTNKYTYHGQGSGFYDRHPEQKEQIIKLFEAAEFLPRYYYDTDDDRSSNNWKSKTIYPQSLRAFKIGENAIHPFLVTIWTNSFHFIVTYYSDELWDWLKNEALNVEHYEKKYRVGNKTVNCLLAGYDYNMNSFQYNPPSTKEATFVWFKYNDALIAIIFPGLFDCWVFENSNRPNTANGSFDGFKYDLSHIAIESVLEDE